MAQVARMNNEFYPLRVAHVRRDTQDAVIVELETPPALSSVFAFRAGQHLTLRRCFDGQELHRNYSICTAPHENMLRIAVKTVGGGLFSRWANEGLSAGDVVDVAPPRGNFTWPFGAPGGPRQYAAFAGGSGIAPILSIMKSALAVEANSLFTLCYGNRTSTGMMFREELEALKRRFTGRATIHHFIEDDNAAQRGVRFDRANVDRILDSAMDAARVEAFFVCGPGPMIDAVEESLAAHGVPRERIVTERFTTHPAANAKQQPRGVDP